MALHAPLAISAAVIILAPGVARADGEADRGQARDLGQAAYEAGSKGDWVKAEELFRKADTLYHAPTLLLGLARARAHLGKYVEAWEDYHRILIETLPPNAGPALKKAVEEAKAEIGTVEGKRARATLNVTGTPNPTVTLDGVAVAAAALGTERAVNPGLHTLHAEADGFKPSDTTFTVAEGAATTASVTLQPSDVTPAPAPATPAPAGATQGPAAPPPADDGGGGTMRTLGLVGMGVGGAGLITGIITGFVAMGQHSSLQGNACANAGCGASDLSSYQSSVSSYKTMGIVSTVSFVAGGVLATGGAVFFFAAPKREAASGSASGGLWITPYVGALSAGAAGTF
jgi:tetratricopeptide (TPR) repeat protein